MTNLTKDGFRQSAKEGLTAEQVRRIRADWERMCETAVWPRSWEDYLRAATEMVLQARNQSE